MKNHNRNFVNLLLFVFLIISVFWAIKKIVNLPEVSKKYFKQNIDANNENNLNNFGSSVYIIQQDKLDVQILNAGFNIQNKPIKNDTNVQPVNQPMIDISNFELLATLITDNNDIASAVVFDKFQNRTLKKKINEKLNDDLRITNILRWQIELTDKHKKKYFLKNEKLKTLPAITNKTSVKNNKINFENHEENLNIDDKKKRLQDNRNQLHQSRSINFTRDEINNFVYKNIEQILSSTNIIPYFENSKMIGIKINKLDKNNVLARYFGVQLNDIILSVNDKKIDNMEKALKIWENIKNENLIRINLLRDGSQLTYILNIRN